MAFYAEDKRERLAPYLSAPNRAWLEETILACVAHSRKFWEGVRNTLCVHPSEKQRKTTAYRDFSDLRNNAVYMVLKLYWESNLVHEKEGHVAKLRRNMLTLVTHVTSERIWADPEDRMEIMKRLTKLLTEEAAKAAEDYETTIREVMPFFILETRAAKEISLAAGGHRSTEDVVEALTKIRESVATVSPVKKVFKIGDVFKQPDFAGVTRVPMCLGSLTMAFGGGIAPRECGFLIAPQNAGKTVFTCQQAAHWTLAQGKKGVIITTEENTGSLEPRIISNTCNIPYGEIVNGVVLHKLSAAQRAAVAGVTEVLDANLRIYEWSGSSGDNLQQDLKSILRNLEDDMKGLDFFILDWLGPAIGNTTGKENVIRFMMDAAGSACVEAAKDLNKIGWFNVQAGITKSKNKRKIGISDIAESTACVQRCALGIGVSAMEDLSDPQEGNPNYFDEQFINNCKTRSSQGTTVKVRREFAFQRFTGR